MISLDSISSDGVQDNLSSTTSESFDQYMKEFNVAKQASFCEAEHWRELGGYNSQCPDKFGFSIMNLWRKTLVSPSINNKN